MRPTETQIIVFALSDGDLDIYYGSFSNKGNEKNTDTRSAKPTTPPLLYQAKHRGHTLTHSAETTQRPAAQTDTSVHAHTDRHSS